MTQPSVSVLRTWTQMEEVRAAAGRSDDGGPLRKVAACAVVGNPLAGMGFVADLGELVKASEMLGTALGEKAADLLGGPVASYGKAAIAGIGGEQEHANAMLTSTFGDAFRAAIGGGRAWISSATKVGVPGCVIDVPLAYKDEIWVRSHYDAVEVRLPDAPLPDEIVVIVAVANRGRINARLGGMSVADVAGREGE